MNPKLLFDGEIIIQELSNADENFVLTSERVRHSKKGWGYNDLSSIILKEISSIKTNYRSYILFILLSIMGGIYSLITYMNEGETSYITYGLVFSLIMILLFLLSRKRHITISSSSGKIEFSIKGYDKEELLELLDKIELAKYHSEKSK